MTDPLVFADLLNGGWRSYAFEHFREGIEICWLKAGEPEVALLHYQPSASAPEHRHGGLETIIVLEGSQRDQHGVYPAGTVVLNPEETKHWVASDDGCVVLIQWVKPVEFL